MIRILVVEDSLVIRELLTTLFSAHSDLHVVGTARNGAEAIEATMKLQPDVITMDIHMPVLSGFEATRRIMELKPTPIVVVSGSSSTDESQTAFRALEAGAIAIVQRPQANSVKEMNGAARDLLTTVRLMSEVKVVRRWPRKQQAAEESLPSFRPIPHANKCPQVIAIGASTGGPVAIQTILARLNKNTAPPILLVQHISDGFLAGFIAWLAETTGCAIQIATDGEVLKNGHVYVSPEHRHLGIQHNLRVKLSDEAPEYGTRPSVAYLFRSVSEQCGANAVAVLLSGMGRDGSAELKQLYDIGALTIAQDKESSAVHGMPGEAINRGGATHVMKPIQIGDFLNELTQKYENK